MKAKPVTSITQDNPRFSTRQAEEYLHMAPNSLGVARFHKTIPIPYYKIGRSCVYTKSDLDDYLESVRVEA